MEIVGKIKLISDIQTFDSGFRKRETVITTEEQYPQHIMIELLGDRVDIINPFKVGDDVKVSINLRGREWVNPQGETKYFNSITAWRIEHLQVEVPTQSVPPTYQTQSAPQTPPPAAAQSVSPPQEEDEEDDLPF
ncbi:MAG: DUF3127 domain-containing protein [Flavobacteriaceae bacterium]|jgi:single-stranded DNA-binding protein|nr:DUF3127 domain-containing protein [Flavobacteriaceae bacterium]